jgi:2-polyprenyl-3-methyl-5-hydroxy-6-metoxy-1,4-benzoquinol methylase
LNGANKMADTENHNPTNNYFRHVRKEIAVHVVSGKHRVLDVGCAAGVFGEYLKRQGCASEVVGIELDALAAKEASTKLDRVLCANLNHTDVVDILKDFDRASFDYIICADVLEHLIDPWAILSDLATYIKPDGRLVVSLPNVQHWSVWVPLIFTGRWEYCEAGIMDWTHLRFFTRATSQKLIMRANLQVIECQPSIWRKSERILNRITFGLLDGWLASQWVLVGQAGSGHPNGKE